jgi:hypothetical protein
VLVVLLLLLCCCTDWRDPLEVLGLVGAVWVCVICRVVLLLFFLVAVLARLARLSIAAILRLSSRDISDSLELLPSSVPLSLSSTGCSAVGAAMLTSSSDAASSSSSFDRYCVVLVASLLRRSRLRSESGSDCRLRRPVCRSDASSLFPVHVGAVGLGECSRWWTVSEVSFPVHVCAVGLGERPRRWSVSELVGLEAGSRLWAFLELAGLEAGSRLWAFLELAGLEAGSRWWACLELALEVFRTVSRLRVVSGVSPGSSTWLRRCPGRWRVVLACASGPPRDALLRDRVL